jgi:hypothetical protein
MKVTTQPAAKKSPTVAQHIKALNGTRGTGPYFVLVLHVRAWNEIQVRLTNGESAIATEHIALGRTAQSRREAIDLMYQTVKAYIEP